MVNKEKEKINTQKVDDNEKKDNRTLGEKIEDGIENTMGDIQDFFYGADNNYTEDIPATIEKPNGIRKVNKVQTRRNFNKKFFKTKLFKIVLIIFGIGFVVTILISLIELMLK